MSKPLRFEGTTLDEARRKVHEQFGTEVSELAVVRHGKERSGGMFGFFQRERFVIEVAPDATDPTGPSATASTTSAAPPKAKRTAVSAERRPATVGRLEALLETTTDTTNVSFDRELESVLADAAAAVAIGAIAPADEDATPFDAELYAGPTDAATSTEPTVPHAPARTATGDPAALAGRLAAAGLHEEYLPDPLFSEPALALPLRLSTIATAPEAPGEPGAVLVIVGEVKEATRVAELVAARLGDAALIVASHRRVATGHGRARTPEEVAGLIVERRLEKAASVVVVDAECREGFVAHAVIGIRPEAIWAVVPADWDEERAGELESIVGRLDALALHGFLRTPRPAALIGRRWPIAYIDGWAATPLSIATRLVEAVGAAA